MPSRTRSGSSPAWPSCDQADGAHDLAGRAEAALEAVMGDEGLPAPDAAASPCATPSIVRMSAPSWLTASARQELIRRPSTMTVQAPHWPRSQPFLVPVRFEPFAQQIEQRDARIVDLDGLRNAIYGESRLEGHAVLHMSERGVVCPAALAADTEGSSALQGVVQ